MKIPFILFRLGAAALLPATLPQSVWAQATQTEQPTPELHFPPGKSTVEVPFEVEGDLMVIPVSINGPRPLRFVLDTGAQGTFLQNSALADQLNLKIAGKMTVRGAGGGGAGREAAVAENVRFNIGGIEWSNGGLVFFPPSTGAKARSDHDGVIGRIIFAALVVEVDWEKRVIRLHHPATYEYTGPGTILPLTFDEGGRPYLTASVALAGEKPIPVKLVVDTGASHAVSLDAGSTPELKVPAGAAKVVLGRGASGEVTGSIGRLKNFTIGGLVLENVPAVFPDVTAGTAGIGGRQGNLGAGVLRRFKVIYDYAHQRMILEPNKFFGEPFDAAPNPATVPMVSPAALPEYVGRFGERTISSENGALYLQRQGGPKLKLVPVAKDEFTLEPVPAARIKFIRDEHGMVTAIHLLNRAGEWEKIEKEQP